MSLEGSAEIMRYRLIKLENRFDVALGESSDCPGCARNNIRKFVISFSTYLLFVCVWMLQHFFQLADPVVSHLLTNFSNWMLCDCINTLIQM
jgi:hypothetical protein